MLKYMLDTNIVIYVIKRRSLEVLDTFKIPTLIRGTKGDDVLAACGQLNSKD